MPTFTKAAASSGSRSTQSSGHLRSHQRMQPRDTLDALGQPSTNQHLPVIIDDLDVVMVLCPVISQKQHQYSRPVLHSADTLGSVEETASDLMVKCSPQNSRGTTSQQRFSPPHDQQAHGLPQDLHGSDEKSADLPAATGTKPGKQAQQMPLDECVRHDAPRGHPGDPS